MATRNRWSSRSQRCRHTSPARLTVGGLDCHLLMAPHPGRGTPISDPWFAVRTLDNAAAGNACAASIVAPAGRSAAVEISSGEVKLNREFDIASTATTILVDFDGDKSVHETGNGRFMMSPVIGVVSVQ